MSRRYMVPAIEAIPSLARFTPALQPRPATPIEAIRPTPPTIRRGMIQHLYNDMGVLVYVGANDKQVHRIAGLLEETVTVGGLQKMASSARNGYEKMVMTRLPTEERHVDKNHRTEEGFLSPDGLLGLGLKAAQYWTTETIAAVKQAKPEYSHVSLRAVNMEVQQEGEHPTGISHQTIQGRRLLPVDAYVFAGLDLDGDKLKLLIKLYTIVTGKYVGTVTFDIVPFSTSDNVTTRLGVEAVGAIWEASPTIEMLGSKRNPAYSSVARGVTALERELWWGKMPEELKTKLEAQRKAENAKRQAREEELKKERQKKMQTMQTLQKKYMKAKHAKNKESDGSKGRDGVDKVRKLRWPKEKKAASNNTSNTPTEGV